MQKTVWRSGGGAASAVLAAFVFCAFALPAQAAVTYTEVDVRIEAPGETVYHGTVYVPSTGCTIADSVGSEFAVEGDKAVCALYLASQYGSFDFNAVYFDGFGLFIDGIRDIASDASNYWLYAVNYQPASVGVADYDLNNGDELLFSYGGFTNTPLRLQVDRTQRRVGGSVVATVDYYSFDYATNIGTYAPAATGVTVYVGNQAVAVDANGQAVFTPESAGTVEVYAAASGYTKSEVYTVTAYERTETFESVGRLRRNELTQKGVAFLLDSMHENGLVEGTQALTEWAAMAFAAAGETHQQLFDAVRVYQPTADSGASELARHILALEAVGDNSRNANGADYVKRLLNAETENQFGSADYCNDDIFAALALIAADETGNSEALQHSVATSMNCVNENGGVSYAVGGTPDVDTTAAWLMMAARLQGERGEGVGVDISEARRNAVQYLRAAQNPDGGWGFLPGITSNASSTSWVLQALRSRHHEAKAMTTNNLNGFHFLADVQRRGGAFRYDSSDAQSSETLNTAYAILALEAKPLPVNKKARLWGKK